MFAAESSSLHNISIRKEGHGRVDVSTIDQFVCNGYVMAAIVFVSSLLQGTLSQVRFRRSNGPLQRR